MAAVWLGAAAVALVPEAGRLVSVWGRCDDAGKGVRALLPNPLLESLAILLADTSGAHCASRSAPTHPTPGQILCPTNPHFLPPQRSPWAACRRVLAVRAARAQEHEGTADQRERGAGVDLRALVSIGRSRCAAGPLRGWPRPGLACPVAAIASLAAGLVSHGPTLAR